MSTIIPENCLSFHGLDAIRIQAPDGASAIVTLQGAQVVSWIPAGRREHLFVSERSAFAAGQPVRGGVPVVFPQFSNRGSLPKHGFARNQVWRVMSTGASHAVFALDSSAETRRLWPHEFALELVVTLGPATLDLQLTVRNAGRESFSFAAALHSYLFVSDVTRVRFEGLPDVEHLERGLDRVYPDTPRETRLYDGEHRLAIAQRGFRDTVVWNPGRKLSASLEDMGPLAFMNMLCVEAAAVEVPIELAAGAQWSGGQTLRVA
jgi:glucose-6-phosphate 1-epimerase